MKLKVGLVKFPMGAVVVNIAPVEHKHAKRWTLLSLFTDSNFHLRALSILSYTWFFHLRWSYIFSHKIRHLKIFGSRLYFRHISRRHQHNKEFLFLYYPFYIIYTYQVAFFIILFIIMLNIRGFSDPACLIVLLTGMCCFVLPLTQAWTLLFAYMVSMVWIIKHKNAGLLSSKFLNQVSWIK